MSKTTVKSNPHLPEQSGTLSPATSHLPEQSGTLTPDTSHIPEGELKTLRQWSLHLPERIRKRFIANVAVSYRGTSQTIDTVYDKSLPDAIEGAFVFKYTPEGHRFWGYLCQHLRDGGNPYTFRFKPDK